ncbi:MAG: ABC-F family ATP-binding cassette domain-containing protein [Candidatus Eisenbacteria bacterium]|nr:ABC-F family ATP-binding cassette domain-containing protein [Candidatus Eisenbacteria bacterium]
MKNIGIEFEDVGFLYDDGSAPLLAGFTCRFAEGWTGVVGANGSGKTTLLRLAVGDLRPRTGRIRIPGPALYGEQRTDVPPADLGGFLRSADPEACRLRGALHVGGDWDRRWSTLSHGERKRTQIAVLLRREPMVLAVDEPTNHLDGEARGLLIDALGAFRGVGLLVSHDRELLDRLCARCLFLDPPEAILRPGGYGEGAREAARERTEAVRRREIARGERRRLEREADRRRRESERGEKGLSKKRLDAKDRDGRAKANLARLTGKDGAAARRLRNMEDRAARAASKEEEIRPRKAYETGIALPGTKSPRDYLLRLSAGTIPLGGGALRHPDLAVGRDDRVALIGPNGAGKSTLVERIIRSIDLPEGRVVYIPQEIDLDRSAAILDEARSLPRAELGRMMSVVSRLGSRPERLLGSGAPTPGEIRKLLLAVGVAREPWLIVLDEPTNHMDLPSVECLEEALGGFPGALLLVSHDTAFLRRLTRVRWMIDRAGEPESFDLRVRAWK